MFEWPVFSLCELTHCIMKVKRIMNVQHVLADFINTCVFYLYMFSDYLMLINIMLLASYVMRLDFSYDNDKFESMLGYISK